MIRLRPPPSATARNRLRIRVRASFGIGMALMAVAEYANIFSGLRATSFAAPAALYATVTAIITWIFLLYVMSGNYRSIAGWHLGIGILSASGWGVLIFGMARGQWELPVPVAAVLAVCAAAAAGAFITFWTRRNAAQALKIQLRRPANRREASATRAAAERVLRSTHASGQERKIARLNLVRARIAESRGDDAPDGLIDAATELRDLIEVNPPDDWLEVMAAATDLAAAMSVRADKHGDPDGYSAALELLTAVAHRMPADLGAMTIVHARRADYHTTMAGRVSNATEATAHAHAAIAELRAAIGSITPTLRALLPDLYADLGVCLARGRTESGDLQAGIELCRTAIRLAGRLPSKRAYAQQALAALLIDQAWETAEHVPDDAAPAEIAVAAAMVHGIVAEAGRLLRRARWYGGVDARPAALGLLARARTVRAIALGGASSDHRAARAWRSAARAAARGDPLDRVEIGHGWVGWAESTQQATWCAEAYWHLMTAVPAAIGVRYLAEERDRVLAGVQSTAEEAGYWLAEAGRTGDAAIALELGRALSLTEVMGRDRPDLADTLLKAGRQDLLARYQAALSEYRAPARPAPGTELSSAAQRAWSEYDTVMREIEEVVGTGLPSVPRLADLASAASDGPIVYLAGAANGGYAITVPAHGPPAFRPLPGLTRTEIAGQAESFLRQPGPAEIETVIQWLWNGGIRDVTEDLPSGALVTIIPVGLLSLLPVHAAGGPTVPGQAPADWAYLADRVTVRYSPNARTLLAARRRMEGLSWDDLTLLAVAAPGPDSPDLLYPVQEVTRIAGPWAQADQITDGAPDKVEAMLGTHNVWHFACHCEAPPDRILDSSLLLTGGRLSLRRILSLPPSARRLAVLSACDTHLTGTHLPDEAVGLPAGLLQAGFAGVVASHWRVHDRATAVLMIRFHELWHGQGIPVAFALAEAQRWLRTATHAERAARLRAHPELRPETPTSQRHGSAPGHYGHPYFWAAFALTGY